MYLGHFSISLAVKDLVASRAFHEIDPDVNPVLIDQHVDCSDGV